MNRIFAGILCLILCLSLIAGCGNDKPEQPIETSKTTDTAEVTDTQSVDTADPDDTDPTDDTEASLVSLRQAMVGTPAMLGVAYIGATDSLESANTLDWIKGLVPDFYGDLPFIGTIDDSRIIGQRYGELYLVLPCDENASVAVNHVADSGEVTEVLYRSDYGHPFLVFVGNTGFPSDTQINIVDSDGAILTYYPALNDLTYVTTYSDGSIYDFTPYAEILGREYLELQDYSWKMPEKVDIVDTSWDASYYLSDGSMAKYHISFNGANVYIQWDGGSLNAPWNTVTEDGVCMLKLYPDTEDERSFRMLLSTEHDYIYLSQDFINDAVRCDEPISLIMDRTYG